MIFHKHFNITLNDKQFSYLIMPIFQKKSSSSIQQIHKDQTRMKLQNNNQKVFELKEEKLDKRIWDKKNSSNYVVQMHVKILQQKQHLSVVIRLCLSSGLVYVIPIFFNFARLSKFRVTITNGEHQNYRSQKFISQKNFKDAKDFP